jgi:hypothetical protein
MHIHIRFDKVVNLSRKDADITGFLRVDGVAAPSMGEIVNLKGNPYIVINVGWAYDDDDQNDQKTQTYCFVRVAPAFNGYKR